MAFKTQWFVYMIRCRLGSLYTGVTTDVARRFAEHQGQGKKGAKYLKGKGPLELVHDELAVDKSAAYALEVKIKGFTKSQKEQYIQLKKKEHST